MKQKKFVFKCSVVVCVLIFFGLCNCSSNSAVSPEKMAIIKAIDFFPYSKNVGYPIDWTIELQPDNNEKTDYSIRFVIRKEIYFFSIMHKTVKVSKRSNVALFAEGFER